MANEKNIKAGLMAALFAALLLTTSCSKKEAPPVDPGQQTSQNPGLNQYDYSMKSRNPYDYRRVGI